MKSFMERLNFTAEEQQFFSNLYQRLTMPQLAQLEALKRNYLNPGEDTGKVNLDVMASLTALAEETGCHHYSMHMLFLLLCAPELPKRYKERGLEEKLAYDLLMDLRAKLTECEQCHQVMGTQTFPWFHGHFLVRRFALGRFQYDPYIWDFEEEYHFGDVHVKKGDRVYKIHIPSSGKMSRESRLESYCAAHDFFGFKKGEPVVLFCRTWFLYKGYWNCFPEGSNLKDFRGDFDMLWDFELEEFADAYRIFYQDYKGDTSSLPRDTTLQRNMIAYLEKGGKFGAGGGVIICDGERILNNIRDNPEI